MHTICRLVIWESLKGKRSAAYSQGYWEIITPTKYQSYLVGQIYTKDNKYHWRSEPFFTVRGSGMVQLLWKQCGGFAKFRDGVVIRQSSDSTPWFQLHSTEMKAREYKNEHVNVYNCIILNSPEVETLTGLALAEYINGNEVWNIMEYSSVRARNAMLAYATVHEPWKHYATWKKSDKETTYCMAQYFFWNVQTRQIHKES